MAGSQIATLSQNERDPAQLARVIRELCNRSSLSSDFSLSLLQGETQAAWQAALGLLIPTNVREKLTAARTYYVRTDGSDSNTGLVNTAGGAFLTRQKAMDVIVGNLDKAAFDVTVNVAAGTYTGGLQIKPWFGGGDVIFVGDITTPSNVFVDAASSCWDASYGPLPGKFFMRGFKLRTSSGFLIGARSPGRLIYTKMQFDTAPLFHVVSSFQGSVEFYGNNEVTGGAHWHWFVNDAALISCSASDLPSGPGTLTVTGAVFFSSAFANCDAGRMNVSGNAYSAPSATGVRFTVKSNGVMQTGGIGLSGFPGNLPGTQTSGGLYT